MTPWEILEIEETTDLALIKKAYAAKVKQHKPENDPEAFQRVREAFEAAKDYAEQGVIPQPEIEPQENQSNTTETDPEELVHHLLYYVVNQQEEQAIEALQQFNRQGLLDNIEFFERFELFLALKLIDKVDNAPKFVSYLIDYYDWTSHREIHADSFFAIALKSLIKQTEYYRFLQKILAKSEVQTKKEAQENGWEWGDCFAAKMLLSEETPSWFFIHYYFSKKKRTAILALLEETRSYHYAYAQYDVTRQALSWLTKYIQTKHYIFQCTYFTALFITSLCLVIYKHSGKSQQPKATPLPKEAKNTTPNRSTPNATTLVISIADYKGATLNGDRRYMLHIPKIDAALSKELTWTIFLLDKQNQLLKNPLNADSSLLINNSNTALKKNEDGSIDLYLQTTAPEQDKQANWLALPKEQFIIMGQFYCKNNAEFVNQWDGMTLKMM